MASCTRDDPLGRRLLAWSAERFPLLPTAVLSALLHGACWSAGRALAGGPDRLEPLRWSAGAAVVLLVFLHLRVFDEHKDREADRKAFPDRLLSRGVVTLGELAGVGAAAIGLEAVLAALLGPRALAAWAAVLAYTLLMRVEFGIGGWLSRHLVLYALTHNPVLALMALFSVAASGAPPVPAHLALALFVSLAGLVYEVGRKIRLPEEEVEGAPTYSAALGRTRALVLLVVLLALAEALLFHLLRELPGAPGAAAALLLLPPLLLVAGMGRPATAPGSRVEQGATLALVGLLGALLVVAW